MKILIGLGILLIREFKEYYFLMFILFAQAFILSACVSKECKKTLFVYVSCDSLKSIDLTFNKKHIFQCNERQTNCIGSGKLVYEFCVESDSLIINASINSKDTILIYQKNIPDKLLFSYVCSIQVFTEKDEGMWQLD